MRCCTTHERVNCRGVPENKMVCQKVQRCTTKCVGVPEIAKVNQRMRRCTRKSEGVPQMQGCTGNCASVPDNISLYQKLRNCTVKCDDQNVSLTLTRSAHCYHNGQNILLLDLKAKSVHEIVEPSSVSANRLPLTTLPSSHSQAKYI